MTASLDRAVEAALLAAAYDPDDGDNRQWMRDSLLAALPHLGVDREALRGLAEHWMEQSRLNDWNAAEAESVGADEAASVSSLRGKTFRHCADELLHLIETNQEATP